MQWVLAAELMAAVGLGSAASTEPGAGGAGRELASHASAAGERPAGGFGALPLSFEANAGQADPAARFLVQASGATFSFGAAGVIVALHLPPAAETLSHRAKLAELRHPRVGGGPSAVTTVRFQGAANPSPSPGAALPGKVNYFTGKGRRDWHTGVPTYRGVRFPGLYRGIDLSYDGSGGALEGTYTVAPGADPSAIRWLYDGAQAPMVDGAGNLRVTLVSPVDGERSPPVLRERAPVAWQEIDGHRRPVAVHFHVNGDRSVGFAVGAHDPARPLIIDPTLTYSTYLPTPAPTGAGGMAVDAQGAAYVAAGGQVTKLAPDGTSIAYTDHANIDSIYGVAVDADGNVYVAGETWSFDNQADNGVTCSGFSGNPPLGGSVKLQKFDPSGSFLLYTGCLDPTMSGGRAVAVDPTGGGAYVAGIVQDSGGSADVVVAKFLTTQTGPASVAYTTTIGGSVRDEANAVAVDSSGDVFVTGDTTSSNFPVAGTPFQSTKAGFQSAFISELNPSGTLVYSTYLGGTGSSSGNGIALDPTGRVHITGTTDNQDFPVRGGFQSVSGGGADAFVTVLTPNATTLDWSTYLGGSDDDAGEGIALTPSGETYVAGMAFSTDFPIRPSPPSPDDLQATNGGRGDAFLARISADGSTLTESTYLGGSADDGAVAVGTWTDSSAHRYAYVAGTTSSADFPTAPYRPLSDSVEAYADSGGAPSPFVSRIGDATGTPFIAPFAGSDQSASVGAAFATPLAVAARPGTNLPTPGLPVTFSAPSSGPSATFSTTSDPSCSAGVGPTVTCTTAKTGIATAPLIANHTLGSYTVVAHWDGAGPDVSFTLTNIPATTFAPSRLEFGPHLVGSSDTQVMSLTDTGGDPLAIGGITAEGDYSETNSCPSTLAVGAGCVITVTFTPTATGPRSGTLAVTDDSAGSPHQVALSGAGEPPGAGCGASSPPTGTVAGWGSAYLPPQYPSSVMVMRDATRLGALSGVRSVAVGANADFSLHGVALMSDGSVALLQGDFGFGSASDPPPAPVVGLGPGSAVAVAAGSANLAARSDGSVVAWGANSSGQLGNGSTTDSSAPVPVTSLGAGSGVTAVAEGGAFSVAVKADGSVLAWGSNSNGQLGNGSTTDSSVPVAVSGLGPGSGVTTVAAGSAFALALKADGSVLAWGSNSNGQLGNHSTTDSSVPVAVSGLGPGSGVTTVAASGSDSLALRADGSVLAWGSNNDGQLGNGSTVDSSVPVAVSGLGPGSLVTSVSSWTDSHYSGARTTSLVLRADGSTLVWGEHEAFDFGRLRVIASSVPVAGPFGSGSGVTAVAPKLAIVGRSGGTLTSSGSNQTLGQGSGIAAGHPLSVTVRDTEGQPVPGVPVTFLPDRPLGFPKGSVPYRITDASGVAVAPPLVAPPGAPLGTGIVWASAPGYGVASFVETVVPITLTAVRGVPQSTVAGSNFAIPVVVQATVAGQPVPGLGISFGVSGRASVSSKPVTTDANGLATSPTISTMMISSSSLPGSITLSATPLNDSGMQQAWTLTSVAGPLLVTATAGTPQSALINGSFGAALTVQLTASGHPVGSIPMTFAAPASGASATFPSGSTVSTDANGLATVPVAANGTPGTYSVTAGVDGLTPDPSVVATFTLTNLPYALTEVPPAGGMSTAPPGTQYPPLQVVVTAGALPVPGVAVSFTAPSSGASGSFPGGALLATATTDATGTATAPAFTANSQAGLFAVTASTANGSPLALNAANLPVAVEACAGTPQMVAVGGVAATPLQAVVTGAGGYRVEGVPVTFTAPSSGPTGTFPGGSASAVVPTNANGIAAAPPFTANTTVGSYTVVATAAGAATSQPFSLTNANGHTLTVTRSGNGSGVVTSSPSGISCGSTCVAVFVSGSTVTLTPTPAARSGFTGWGGNCTGTGSCTVTMNADMSVTAGFTTDPTVTGLVPASGATTGGAIATISGARLTSVTTVHFGAAAAPAFTVIDDSTIQATAPPGAAGPVDVTVTTPTATSATSSADRFTYVVAAAGSYQGMQPLRICDTRPVSGFVPSNQCNTGSGSGPLGPNQERVIGVCSGFGGSACTLGAVTLNVTITNPSDPNGFLIVYPTGTTPRPNVSNLNYGAGSTRANLVQVRVPASGQITLYNSSGTVDVIVDLEGTVPSSGGAVAGSPGLFHPLPPARICDTRPPSPYVTANPCDGAGSGPLGAGQTRNIQVTGEGGVPATGVSAVVLNTTVTNTTGASFLTEWPAANPEPNASNLNWASGQTVPNRVVVPVGHSGQVSVANFSGTADLIVDVGGWFGDGSDTAGSAFTGITPVRVCDTRPTSSYVSSNQCNSPSAAPLQPGHQTITVQTTGGTGQPPAGARGIVANVTATITSASSFLTVWPSDVSPQPNISDLNWAAGQTVANLVVVQPSSGGAINLNNYTGTTDAIVDVVGYYS